MKIIFVHQGRENLGIEYLSAFLKREGHQVDLAYDPNLFGLNDNVFYIPALEKLFDRKERLIKKIIDFNPDTVAFSVYTGTCQWCYEIAREIKKRLPVRIVFGGIHSTLAPERIIENDFVDFVIVGEGEEALLELVESLSSGKGGQHIQNLLFKQNGKIIKNEVRRSIDIEQLPLPDKSIFEEFVIYRNDYIILTSRGCFFNCSYCCESYMNKLYCGTFFRRRSVNSVMAELRFMKEKYNFREVMFNDSIFFTDKKWLKELLQLYKNEINVPFKCFGNIRFLDEEIAELLKWAGCYAIEFGLQTLNENVRKHILNRSETHNQCKKAFQICDKFKLRYDIDHMFGLPEEKVEDFKYAAEFYSQLKYLNRIKCHNLTYFPNLSIVEIARKNSILTEADINDISNGKRKDNFFHLFPEQHLNQQELMRSFQIFYKILPLLPGKLVKIIIQRHLYRKFHYIPSVIVIFLQILVAVKGRDYRYVLYLKNYSLSIIKALKRRIPKKFIQFWK